MTPSLFELVVKCDLPSVVNITLAGERVPQHQLETWQGKTKHFVISYGPTETTTGCTAMEFDNNMEHASSNIIGLSLPYVTYYVLDTHLQLLPVGVMGELYIGGEGVGGATSTALTLHAKPSSRTLSALVIAAASTRRETWSNYFPMDPFSSSGEMMDKSKSEAKEWSWVRLRWLCDP